MAQETLQHIWLAVGKAAVVLDAHQAGSELVRATTGGAALAYTMLSVGFCGGLSTLSTAAMDVVDLFRRGTYALAVAYVMLTAGTGMGALWLGLVIAA